MPPLTGMGERCAPRATWFCIDDAPVGRSLSLCESTHACQGSGLAASLAPRSWHEPAVQHPDRASSSQGCLMSLRLSFPPP